MKLRGQKNQCQGCKEYFNSNIAFEKHRTGQHGVDRRCRTRDEMIAKGMSLNAHSFWITERNERFEKESENDMQEN
jgi:hypothetical protein